MKFVRILTAALILVLVAGTSSAQEAGSSEDTGMVEGVIDDAKNFIDGFTGSENDQESEQASFGTGEAEVFTELEIPENYPRDRSSFAIPSDVEKGGTVHWAIKKTAWKGQKELPAQPASTAPWSIGIWENFDLVTRKDSTLPVDPLRVGKKDIDGTEYIIFEVPVKGGYFVGSPQITNTADPKVVWRDDYRLASVTTIVDEYENYVPYFDDPAKINVKTREKDIPSSCYSHSSSEEDGFRLESTLAPSTVSQNERTHLKAKVTNNMEQPYFLGIDILINGEQVRRSMRTIEPGEALYLDESFTGSEVSGKKVGARAVYVDPERENPSEAAANGNYLVAGSHEAEATTGSSCSEVTEWLKDSPEKTPVSKLKGDYIKSEELEEEKSDEQQSSQNKEKVWMDHCPPNVDPSTREGKKQCMLELGSSCFGEESDSCKTIMNSMCSYLNYRYVEGETRCSTGG